MAGWEWTLNYVNFRACGGISHVRVRCL